jgi:hypothetical protein
MLVVRAVCDRHADFVQASRPVEELHQLLRRIRRDVAQQA